MADEILVGGIELGGTKTLLVVGRPDGTILDWVSLPTVEPAPLTEQIAAYFSGPGRRFGALAGIGVGAFGPVVLDRRSVNYGSLLQTNKPGWSGFDLHQAITAATGLPVHLVTDVGAAAIGEARLGALRDIDLGVYLTVGTGIGGALMCHGWPLPAVLHPELGHLPLLRHAADQSTSTCGFHPHCAEGLAAGPAILKRFGQPLNQFAADGPEIALIGDYLGQLCAALTLTLSPRRIVVGGGVAKADGLLSQTRLAHQRHLNGYASEGTLDPGYICPPALGDQAGMTGALIAAGTITTA